MKNQPRGLPGGRIMTKSLAQTNISIIFGAQNRRKLTFWRVYKSVRGWIDVLGDPYVWTWTVTTPGDPLGAEL